MKKSAFLFLLVLIGFSCSKNQKRIEIEELKKDTIVVNKKSEIKGNFFIYEHDLSMYNKKYFMRISPVLDSINNRFESEIILTKKTDTIFNKRINIDSLGQAILKRKSYEDRPEYDKITTDYQLRKVVYHNVRANNLYFEATIISDELEKQLKVIFYVPYQDKNIGKLHILNFGNRSFGKNKGEIENSKNKIIKVPEIKKAT